MDRKQSVFDFIEQLIRQLAICGVIEDASKQTGEIKEILKLAGDNSKFSRHIKTIERDIKDLEELLEIKFIKGKKEKEFQFPEIKKEDNAKYKAFVQFYLALLNLHSAMNKEELERSIETLVKNLDFPLKILSTLNIAIYGNRPVKIRYYSTTLEKEYEFEVHPYALTHRSKKWFLVAYSPYNEEFRHYQLHFIKDVEIDTDDRNIFEPDKDFNLDSFYRNAFKVFRNDSETRLFKIKFSKDASDFPETYVYHPAQKMEIIPGGSVILSLEADSIEEIVNWAFGHGENVEVLEPKEARQRFKEKIKKLKKIY